jgi:acetyltransferase-like isoleucine patch superfamily enzyme
LPTGESNSLHEKYPQYEIGRWTYGDLTVHSWGEGATVTIGSFSSIAPGVQVFLGGEHRSDWVTTFPFNVLWEGAEHIRGHPKTKGNVVIGNDVWIGTEAMIMSGVTIGDGAVVGARSLVARDVEPYSVVAGNPARLVRRRFDDQLVNRLLDLKWWDCENEELAQLLPLLLAPDIEAFLRETERRRNAG